MKDIAEAEPWTQLNLTNLQGDVKKFMYVKDPKTGNVKKVNFVMAEVAKGKAMKIRKNNQSPKSFRAQL